MGEIIFGTSMLREEKTFKKRTNHRQAKYSNLPYVLSLFYMTHERIKLLIVVTNK
jgi:hypothetical protein